MNLGEIFQPDLDEGINDPNIFKAVFMAGPPGAGKNMIIRALGLNAAGLRLQDTDHTLAYLNKASVKSGRPADLHSDEAYGRSLNTTLRRQHYIQQEMLGLIINTTGRDASMTQELNLKLRKAGYSTFMVFVDVHEEVATQRIGNRAASATDLKDKRPVGNDYFKAAYKASKENATFYALMFGDNFALVDNSADYGMLDNKGNIASTDGKQQMDVLTKIASRKIARFLAAPLSPIAQQIVDATKNANFNR